MLRGGDFEDSSKLISSLSPPLGNALSGFITSVTELAATGNRAVRRAIKSARSAFYDYVTSSADTRGLVVTYLVPFAGSRGSTPKRHHICGNYRVTGMLSL